MEIAYIAMYVYVLIHTKNIEASLSIRNVLASIQTLDEYLPDSNVLIERLIWNGSPRKKKSNLITNKFSCT